MPKRTRDHESWLIEKLTDPTRAASYLNAAREDSQEMFFEALRDVAQARQNMSDVAKDAKVTRESLYKITSAMGNPTYGTFDAVLRALGLDFDIKPRRIRVAVIPPASGAPSRRRARRLAAKPRVKLKQITPQSSGVAANVGSAQHAGNGVSYSLFWCTEKPKKQQDAFLGQYANPSESGADPIPPPRSTPPAYMVKEFERIYGRQESVGNDSINN